MTTNKIENEIKDILTSNGFLRGDVENFFTAMSEVLDLLADETEKSEPYAVNTINAYREAASNVSDYDGAIIGLGSDTDTEEEEML